MDVVIPSMPITLAPLTWENMTYASAGRLGMKGMLAKTRYIVNPVSVPPATFDLMKLNAATDHGMLLFMKPTVGSLMKSCFIRNATVIEIMKTRTNCLYKFILLN